MKTPLASSFALVLLAACPADDDGDTGGDTGMTTTMTTTTAGSESSTGASASTTTPSDSSEGSSDSSAEPGPPEINGISWTQVDGCVMNTASDVNVVVDVTDPDNDVSELTISGIAIGCTGDINAPMVTLLCPQVATYNATVTVEDPDGNSDMLPIAIEPCMDGMAP
ncbi:MAG TPA: hypothetical protein VG755_37700 [Nannocystaceae bacterium]|nr:hypothetical protein [Nannocystaceae bacterium]